MLNFIIPIRHQENADNWSDLVTNLRQTAKSIANQDCDSWRAVVVANKLAELPEFPRGFTVRRVDFEPNEHYRQQGISFEEFFEAFRLDKGRRALEGIRQIDNGGHIMVVDDDDLVSRQLSGFVRDHAAENGWALKNGYAWSSGSGWLYPIDDFSKMCGTSMIVRSDLLSLSDCETVDDALIRRKLGSHRFLEEDLAAEGMPLSPLPFRGAIYRMGHRNAHSKSRTVLTQYILNGYTLRNPKELLKRLPHLRRLDKELKAEFFGT